MPKKYINLLLISFAFCVWMIVFYQLVLSNGDDQNEEFVISNTSTNTNIKSEKQNIEQYLNKVSIDPFITPFNYSAPKPKKQKPKPPPKPQHIPKLHLLGILSDKDGPLAIIEFPDNSIHFVREKQVVDKFTITNIASDSVLYKYENNKQSVSLN